MCRGSVVREAELKEEVQFGHPSLQHSWGTVTKVPTQPAVLGLFPGTCCPHSRAESVSHFAQRKALPISRILARYLRCLITSRAFQ